jgi:hypothetical protein
MSQYLPEVAWSTIASNVTLGASAYRYNITVNPLDPNEPGASPMTVAINDWFIDFAGYPFLIENVAGSVLTVYDILERGDGVVSAYAPYANKLGYVYRPLNGAIILTQAQLRKLDASAADIIQPIEKGIQWKYRGLELNDGVVNKSNITSLELSGLTLTDNTEDGWQGGSKLALDVSLVGLSDVYGTPTDQYVPKWIEANNRFEFAAVSGGSSQWTTSGSDIYYNSGNVYIGKTSGVYKLDVNGTIGGGNIETNSTSFSTKLGIDAGANEDKTSSRFNIFIGQQAGGQTTTGKYNVFIGSISGYTNTTQEGNTFVGYACGYYNSSGYNNVFTGYRAGYKNSTGSYNTYFGSGAGYQNQTGNNNTALGYLAGNANTGADNVFIGSNAGKLGTTNTKNTIIGSGAGYSNTTGGSCVYIGYSAGYYETGSNKLFIDNQLRTDEATSRTSSMIYGVFNSTASSQELYLNSKFFVRHLSNAIKTDRVYYNTSTKELSYYSDAFTALTDGATVTWDCATGLNKTLTTSRSSISLSFSNVLNGMRGTLLVYTTSHIVINIPSGFSGLLGVYDYDSSTVFEGNDIVHNPTTYTNGLYIEWLYDGTNYIYNMGVLFAGATS